MASRENEIGKGWGLTYAPPTPAHIASAIFADPPHRFGGEGRKKRIAPSFTHGAA
jgi:hypothetical protein